MNRFGNRYGISIFGESHGPAVGVVIDGMKPGVPLCEEDFTEDLDRRRSGRRGTTPRTEADAPQILSGLFNGFTTGAPITIIFRNGNTRSSDYDKLKNHPRPSHADLTATMKYGGFNDPRGGGHFSGRITLGLVAGGVPAKKILAEAGISVRAEVESIGGATDKEQIEVLIDKAVREGDSLGGIIKITASGLPGGMGEPFFDSLESVISHLMFSIPAVKGIEFGAGFGAGHSFGSLNNDRIVSGEGRTATNNDGGINGGISNGNDIVCRIAVKPTPSINVEQHTWNFATGAVEPLKVAGRHDACVALRVPVVAEAAMAIALMQFLN